MGCCGGKRQQAVRSVYGAPGAVAPRPDVTSAATVPAQAGQVAMFIYTGAGALVVKGSVSGRLYHFAQAGAPVAADARDAPALADNPRLRRL